MSGGSYNYLCYAVTDELMNKHGEDLRNMVSALADAGAKDAAEETETIIAILRHFDVRMGARLRRLQPVWKAIEGWHSGDTGPDHLARALSEYRADVEPPVSSDDAKSEV
jgi:hypothetical protein